MKQLMIVFNKFDFICQYFILFNKSVLDDKYERHYSPASIFDTDGIRPGDAAFNVIIPDFPVDCTIT